MVTSLGILKLLKVGSKLFLLVKCRTIDSLQSCFLCISSPVCHGRRGQLEGLDPLCVHQVGACAQVNEFSLIIEGNLCILRKLLDQLYLVWLFSVFHKLDRFISRKGKSLQLMTFLDDLLHLCFDLVKIIS